MGSTRKIEYEKLVSTRHQEKSSRTVDITAAYQGRHEEVSWKTANLIPAEAPDLIESRFPVNYLALHLW